MSQSIRDRYKLIRGISVTREGRVFEAVDIATGSPVEIRVWNAADGDDARLLQFCKTAEKLALLHHPNIVRVLDAMIDHHAYFLATEPAPRESLASIMESGPIDLGRLKTIASSVLCGLEAAHAQGLVHGRLRPEAIVVSADDHAMVRDFGLEELLCLQNPAVGISSVEQLYCPPKQTERRRCDPQTDLYSLGVILYQAVAGVSPTSLDDGPAVVALERFIRDGIPVSMLSQGVPADWDDFIGRCVATDPGKRFATAADMRSQVQLLSESRVLIPDFVQPEPGAEDVQTDEAALWLELPPGSEGPDDSETLTLVPVASAEEPSDTGYAPIQWDELPAFQPSAAAEEPYQHSGPQSRGWDPVAGSRDKVRRRDRVTPGPPRPLLAALAACVILGSVAALTLARMHRGVPPKVAASRVVALSVPGRSKNRVYASGTEVTLNWGSDSHASLYKLQISYTGTGSSGQGAKQRDRLVTASVRAPAYRLRVLGARAYRWRVAAQEGGKFSRFSSWNTFSVLRPDISRPAPLRPRKGSVLRPGEIRLCWTAVPSAMRYTVRVTPGGSSGTASTCSVVHARAGTYAWSVAADVRAARLYRGPWSKSSRFRVQPAARPHRVVKRRSRTVHRAPTPPAANTAPAPAPTPTPVPVQNPPAVAQPVVPAQPAPTAVIPAPAPAAPSAPQVQAPAPTTNQAPATNQAPTTNPSTSQGSANQGSSSQGGSSNKSSGCIAFVNC